MAHRNIEERRLYVHNLLDSGTEITKEIVNSIAHMFNCSSTAIRNDIGVIRGTPYHRTQAIRDMHIVSYHNWRSREEYGRNDIITTDEWRALQDYYDNTCLACFTTGQMTLDHVVPLSKGGRNLIVNVQPLCLPCNLKKSINIADYRIMITPEKLSLLELMLNQYPDVHTPEQLLDYLIDREYQAKKAS